jgi:hypothetical protein
VSDSLFAPIASDGAEALVMSADDNASIVISHVFEHLALAVAAYRSRETPGAFDLGSQDSMRFMAFCPVPTESHSAATHAQRLVDDHDLELWRGKRPIAKLADRKSRVTKLCYAGAIETSISREIDATTVSVS